MKQPCGCCAGVEVVTPQPEANRPGLPALSYRLGTYATFVESMIARLSNLYIDVPASPGSTTLKRIYPLQNLTTRELNDPSISLLDAWATVADVLTFYQERIANEGYLGTAIERRSVLELARLVGYRLRPGISSTVYLAFTVTDGFNGIIPAGTRAQSIPGPGETPQFFETSIDLAARDVWNALKPRLTRPQVITLGKIFGTDAATRETVYFTGISTNLNPGDALLFVLGETQGQQVLRKIANVDAQAVQQRTETTLVLPPPRVETSVQAAIMAALEPFLQESSTIFAENDTAQQVAQILLEFESKIQPTTTAEEAVRLIQPMLPELQEKHDLAVRRKFTRLEPWIADILAALNSLIEELPQLSPLSSSGAGSVAGEGATGTELPVITAVRNVPPAPLQGVTAILEPLTRPPSLQPANSVQLERSIGAAFAAESDISARLLTTFFPSAADTLYPAWTSLSIRAPQEPPQVHAMRVKAGLFANSSNGLPSYTNNQLTGYATVTLKDALATLIKSNGAGLPTSISAVPLDGTYDKITNGSWVAIDRPEVDGNSNPTGTRKLTFHRVTGVVTVSMITSSGYSAKSTQLTLDPAWLSEPGTNLSSALGSSAVLRGTVVYAQSEQLDLAEEPLDTDVEGDTIELDEVYDGFDSGRWIIVSGERTDIPNVTGVMASELVMISAVSQSVNAPNSSQSTALGNIHVNEPVPRAGIPTSSPGPDTAQSLHTVLTLANKLAYSYDSNTVTIYGNVVKATNGQTQGEVLGDGDASQSGQQFALHQSPLTYLPAPTPAGAQSTLTVRVNEVAWNEADNLLTLGPADRGYITRTDDDDQTTVIFGTGEHGLRVPSGTANVKAVYRSGTGRPGNVAATQISQLATQPLGAKSVINPLPATGGADRDSRDQARRNVPLAVLALDRLVSVEDYADFARTYAGIGKASSVRLSDGRQLIVHVTIAGKDDIPIDQNSDLYRNLVLALQQSGDPHQPLQVALRTLELLVISAGVKVQTGYTWESVAANLRSALLDFLSFDRRELGQTAFLSEAISVMQQVAGVQYVNVQVFDSVSEGVTAAQLARLASKLKRRDFVQARLAQVNPKATTPDKHIVPAQLAILTPDIPDTLILTEITA